MDWTRPRNGQDHGNVEWLEDGNDGLDWTWLTPFTVFLYSTVLKTSIERN